MRMTYLPWKTLSHEAARALSSASLLPLLTHGIPSCSRGNQSVKANQHDSSACLMGRMDPAAYDRWWRSRVSYSHVLSPCFFKAQSSSKHQSSMMSYLATATEMEPLLLADRQRGHNHRTAHHMHSSLYPSGLIPQYPRRRSASTLHRC